MSEKDQQFELSDSDARMMKVGETEDNRELAKNQFQEALVSTARDLLVRRKSFKEGAKDKSGSSAFHRSLHTLNESEKTQAQTVNKAHIYMDIIRGKYKYFVSVSDEQTSFYLSFDEADKAIASAAKISPEGQLFFILDKLRAGLARTVEDAERYGSRRSDSVRPRPKTEIQNQKEYFTSKIRMYEQEITRYEEMISKLETK